MTVVLSIENRDNNFYEKQVHKACEKIERYFSVDPKIECKILNFKRSVSVKISVEADGDYYFGEAQGSQINDCIHKAVDKLIRIIDDNKEILLKKRNRMISKKLNFEHSNEIHYPILLQ